MASKIYDVRIDMSNGKVVDSGFTFNSGDYGKIALRITVTNSSDFYNEDDVSVMLVFHKPNGEIVTGTPTLISSASYNDLKFSYTFQGSEVSCAGNVLADIKFTYPNGRVSTGKFMFFVEVDTLNGISQAAGTYISDYEKIMESLKYGKIISKITGPVSEGLVDTYTIVFTDATTQTYTVTNGADGGSEVEVEQIQTSGTKIAEITIDDEVTEIYAPEGGGSTVEVTQTLTSGTKIAEISVDRDSTDIYAPTIDIDNNVLGGDAYNSSTVYQVGDMCIDNNCLYEKIGTAESGFKPSDYPSKWKKVTLKSVANTVKYKDVTMFGSYDEFSSETWYSYNVGTDADMSGRTILSVFCIYYGVGETNARLHYNINRDNNMFYVNSNVSGRRLEFRFVYI